MTGEDVLSKKEGSSSTLESGALELRDLTIGYDKPLISGINKEILPGETIAILGPSGIGKTTLLRTIAGLIVPLSGEVIHDFPKRSGIGYIPQRLGLVRHSSVRSNVSIGARTRMPKGYPAIFPLGKQLNSDVDSALSSLGIKEYSNNPVRILSGGQQRRVAIARAISHQPNFLLLDEPTAGLDPVKTNMIFDIVKKLNKKLKITILAVSSDVKGAIKYFDEFIVVENTKIHWKGDRASLLKKPTKLIKDLV